jgi:hypothetical protein
MLRHSILALGLLTSFTQAQPVAVQSAPSGHAYKVAFWYLADQPVSSLKYQVYDVAKGQYDAKAVDRWSRDILDHHPEYGAYIREISTEGQPGATEAERLDAAIATEKGRWASLQRESSKPIPRITNLSPVRPGLPGSRMLQGSRMGLDWPALGSSGEMSNLPTSPFPYPYRLGPR